MSATKSVRRKAIRGMEAAEAMQPLRCSTCGTAVRKGFNDPCKCFPDIKFTA